jgi:hypothetical protein
VEGPVSFHYMHVGDECLVVNVRGTGPLPRRTKKATAAFVLRWMASLRTLFPYSDENRAENRLVVQRLPALAAPFCRAAG